MEMIRGWILALCSLALLYTILEGFLPEKEPFPVIKLVCVLYILITLLTPAKQVIVKNALPQLPDTDIISSEGEAFYQSAVIKQTAANLKRDLTQLLVQNGFSVEQMTVRLQVDEEGMIGTPQIHVVLAEDKDGVRQLICDQLGCDAVVTVEEV